MSLFGTNDAQPQAASEQPAPEREPGAGWYDHPTSRPATTTAPAEPAPNPEAELAARLYAKEQPPEIKIDVPEAIAKLREGNSAMYAPEMPYEQAITSDDFADDGTPAEAKAAVVNELRRMAHDTGIEPIEMREVVNIAKELAADPPTPETELQWQQAAVKRVMELNSGDIAAAQRDVDLARQLVARDPRLVKILEATRLGNAPRVIEKFVQLARRERLRGRL
jgi:hypothetical protein